MPADAALGFNRREAVTIPALSDIDQWKTFSEARRARYFRCLP
jgi:hypothetical protein